MRPVVISVAITGSVPRKADTPAVPVTPAEQIESTHEAYEVGASLVHIHVRNPDESSSSDPDLFAQVQEGIRKHCPDMIVQFSTGGRGRDPDARGSALYLMPDMASLSTGSVNFPNIVFENPPALVRSLAGDMQRHGIKPEIEVFDLSMIHATRSLIDEGLLDGTPHMQFVFGIKNALPAERPILELLVAEAKRVLGDFTWTAAAIGRHQAEVAKWAVDMGGHVRTGLEDNIRISRTELASSNAELVEIAARTIVDQGQKVATVSEARTLLGLPQGASR